MLIKLTIEVLISVVLPVRVGSAVIQTVVGDVVVLSGRLLSLVRDVGDLSGEGSHLLLLLLLLRCRSCLLVLLYFVADSLVEIGLGSYLLVVKG